MAQRVHPDMFHDSRPRHDLAHDPLQDLFVHMVTSNSARPRVYRPPFCREYIQDTGKLPAPVAEEHVSLQRKERSVRFERPTAEYTESHHTDGRPSEVLELYPGLDRFCQESAPGRITRCYKSKTVNWTLDKAIFCCANVQQGGLRVWVKTDPKELDPSSTFARDVSRIGPWGVGDVELAINSLDRLRDAEAFVRKSFENATQK
jgi:predicted transport protein